jgi:ribosome-binding protein aMBF1 (putative translation factor)
MTEAGYQQKDATMSDPILPPSDDALEWQLAEIAKAKWESESPTARAERWAQEEAQDEKATLWWEIEKLKEEIVELKAAIEELKARPPHPSPESGPLRESNMTATRLSDVRERLGWPRRRMSRLLGCSVALIRRWEAGEIPIPAEVKSWCRELDRWGRSYPQPPREWRVRTMPED